MRMLVLVISILLSGQMAFSDEKGDSREEKYQVKLFGTKKSEPIKTGFFFYDGKYIPPPYVVEQFGNAIVINNFITWGPVPYLPIHKRPKIPEAMPEIPEGIKEDTDIDSDLVSNYCYNVRLFVMHGLKNKTALERTKIIAEQYIKLPCIKNVHVLASKKISVELQDGDSFDWEFRMFPRTEMALKNLKKGDSLKFARKWLLDNYNKQVKFLKKNGVLIGMRSFIPVREENPCPGDLYEFVCILNSKKPFEEKVLSLKNGFVWRHTSDEEVLKIFSNYKYSKELTQRVETLYKKWKKEHPEEFKRYEIEKRRKPFVEQYEKISERLEELEDNEEEFYIKGLEEKGKEYREKHKDERERLLEKLKELESKIERIK